MKCSKCSIEIKEGDKYCPNCGEKIKEAPHELEDLVKDCAKIWYIFGFMKGCSKQKNALTDLEKLIKKKFPEIWIKYEEIINYWKEIIEKNNEEDKKKDGSKRTGVSKTKIIKTEK